MVTLNKIINALLMFAGLLFYSTGYADPVQINVTGKVIAAACTVDSGLASGQTVDLGTLGRTSLLHPGDAGDWRSFTLSLSNCPPGSSSSTVTFTGTPDSHDVSLFANTGPALTAAQNVAVQIAKDSDRSIILSNTSTFTVAVDSSHNAIFPLAARLFTPVGGVQAGAVVSTVLVNFTYQ